MSASKIVLAVTVVAGVLAATGAGPDGDPTGSAGGCRPSGVVPTGVAGYDRGQMGHAATIVAVGRRMDVPERGRVVAIATAMQESRLRNLDYGDRDSLGLFQQRPSMGWGSPAQVRNPTYAATRFYRALLAVPGWERMSVTRAAQTVQRSAYPSAYAKHETNARAVVAAVSGATCASGEE